MSGNSLTLPNNWRPRPYQRDLFKYMERGGKRAFLLWHRRSGKDDTCLHLLAILAIQRPATYWYMLPQQGQVRRAIWDAVDGHTGRRRIDWAFPDAICEQKRHTDMTIKLRNGSMIHFVGSDSFNSLVGSPPLGMVFSEYSLTNPAAWAYLRPILDENGGWAIFNTTPRGKNHAYGMFKFAQDAGGWFTQVCLPDQTQVFEAAQLEDARAQYKKLYGPEDGEALFQQEYWCSFESSLMGSYYGAQMAQAQQEGRLTSVPWDPNLNVITAWDLGIDDSTAIWFAQIAGRELHIIDYLEGVGGGLAHYVKVLQEKPYVYGHHLLPHDVRVREMGTGQSRLETLYSLGMTRVEVVAAQGLADGIQAVRGIMPRCWFDEKKCANGLEALRAYRRSYDEEKKIYGQRPVHDWASHAADAFRYLALGLPLANTSPPAKLDYTKAKGMKRAA